MFYNPTKWRAEIQKNNLSGRKLSKIIDFERHSFESCSAKPTCKIT